MSPSDKQARPHAPARIGVVGLGAWGSSLALYCTRIGHSVVAWHRPGAHSDEITASGTLSIGKNIREKLPAPLSLTPNVSDCASCDLTIVALPASAWREVVPKLKSASLIVSATKGLDKESQKTPLTFAAEEVGISADRLCVLSGPSFASDLFNGTPLSMVCASNSASAGNTVARTLSSNTVRIYSSTDTLGVELGGILKNIIAIAVGICDALGYGPSTRAALVTRGLAEMTRIATAWGANPQTLTGLSGLGDLVMTSTDNQSRNRSVGLLLGEGKTLSETIACLGATAEGVYSAPLVATLAKKMSVEAPIVDVVVQVLSGALKPQEAAHQLMTRPLKAEVATPS